MTIARLTSIVLLCAGPMLPAFSLDAQNAADSIADEPAPGASASPEQVTSPGADQAASGGSEQEASPGPVQGQAARPGGGIQLATEGGAAPILVTDEDLRSLAAKLHQFGGLLSLKEKLMMDWLLQRAAAAPADDPNGTKVQGMLFTPPLAAAGALDPGDGAEGEPAGEAGAVLELEPAPAAALARALSMKLEKPDTGAAQPSTPPQEPATDAAQPATPPGEPATDAAQPTAPPGEPPTDAAQPATPAEPPGTGATPPPAETPR